MNASPVEGWEGSAAALTDQKLLSRLVTEVYPRVVDEDEETTPVTNIVLMPARVEFGLV